MVKFHCFYIWIFNYAAFVCVRVCVSYSHNHNHNSYRLLGYVIRVSMQSCLVMWLMCDRLETNKQEGEDRRKKTIRSNVSFSLPFSFSIISATYIYDLNCTIRHYSIALLNYIFKTEFFFIGRYRFRFGALLIEHQAYYILWYLWFHKWIKPQR